MFSIGRGDIKMSTETSRPGGLSEREPVTLISSITNSIKTLVLAVLALALAFDWVNWSDAQNAAVLGVVAAGFVVMSSVGAAFVRQRVTPIAAPRTADGTPLAPTSSPST
jgi:hypothetical protein